MTPCRNGLSSLSSSSMSTSSSMPMMSNASAEVQIPISSGLVGTAFSWPATVQTTHFEGSEAVVHRGGWLRTVPLILATTIGSGALILPGAFATLGWYGGVTCLSFCYCASFFVALLLHRLHLRYRHPAAESIGDISALQFGWFGGYLAWGLLYFGLLQFLGNYLFDVARIIENFSGKPHAVWLAALMLVPTSQIRRLHNLMWLSILSVISITVILGIYATFILEKAESQSREGMHCTHHALPRATWGNVVVAISQVAFTFNGQVIFLEIQNEMEQPASFSKALHLAYPLMLLFYAASAGVSYALCGEYTPLDIVAVLHLDRLREMWFENVLMLVHHATSYSIFQQVLAREVAVWFVPAALENRVWSRFLWLMITVCQLGLTVVICVFVPHVLSLFNFLGMLVSTQAFSFPCMLVLACCYRERFFERRKHDVVAAVACCLIIVFTLVLTVGGVLTTVKDRPD